MQFQPSDKPQRLNNALNFFTKKPAQVFALAIVFVLIIVLVLSMSVYLGYLADLEISQIFSPMLTASAILFSALWASTFVVQNMYSAKETAKLQETLKLIRAAELDREFILARGVWSTYRSKEKYDEQFAALIAAFMLDQRSINEKQNAKNNIEIENKSYIDSELSYAYGNDVIRRDASLLLTYFNFFELSSLAIKKEIMDEVFFREWYGTNFVRTWNISINAIGALRKLHHNPRLYTEWQKCAQRWASELDLNIKEPHDYHLKDLVKLAEKWHG